MKFFNILIPYCCTVLVRVPAEKIDSEDEAFELAIGNLDKLEPTLQLMATEGPIDEEILSVLDGRYTKSVIYYDSCRRLSQKIGWSDNHSSVAELQRDCNHDLVPMSGAQECANRLLAAEQRLYALQEMVDEHAKDVISLVETWQQRVDVMKSAHTLEVDALHAKLLDLEISRPQAGAPLLVIQFEAGQAEPRICSVIYSDSGRILEVVDGEYRRDGSRYKNARFLGVYKTTVAEYRRLIHEFGERK